MTPDKFLARSQQQLMAMRQIKRKHVAVGVLASEASKRVYESGADVLQVAAANEFGTTTIPQRSFLVMPQELKAPEISKFIRVQLGKVLEGREVKKGLGLIGVFVTNVSVDAFDTGGFGKWPPHSDITTELRRSGGASSIKDVANAAKASKSAFFEKARDGENALLIDTGTLKNSVTYEVR